MTWGKQRISFLVIYQGFWRIFEGFLCLPTGWHIWFGTGFGWLCYGYSVVFSKFGQSVEQPKPSQLNPVPNQMCHPVQRENNFFEHSETLYYLHSRSRSPQIACGKAQSNRNWRSYLHELLKDASHVLGSFMYRHGLMRFSSKFYFWIFNINTQTLSDIAIRLCSCWALKMF